MSVVALCPASPVRRQASRDAAVEQQRQGHVTAGAPALADQLDGDGGEDRDDHRGDRGGGVRHEADGHARHGDVADAVTHEGLASLDEVGADGRGGRAR